MKLGKRTEAIGRGRGALSLAFAILALAALAVPASASAADRAVRLTLDASTAACTAFDQLDCSYLEARNGNKPAPDPNDPSATAPTFLNLALLASPVIIDGTIHDDGTFTVADGEVDFPSYPTTLSNALVGDVAVQINIVQTDAWSGTFDEATGALSLTAPLGMTFKLNCDAADTTHPLCSALFGPEGNMGTWRVDAKAPVDPLTTGHLTAPTPPASYWPDWLGPDAEDGSPFDPGTQELTLINNDLELEHIEASNCIDPSSTACSNAAIGGLIAAPLNDAIGADGSTTPPKDTVPGAIDLRLAFVLAEPPTLEADPSSLAFATQPQGTSSASQSIGVTAFELGDVAVDSLYTDGGDASDFWVANDRCGRSIDAGETCDLALRFTPSAGGARSTTLYAKVTNPVTGDEQVIELATLTGTGGDLPQGPQGPKGDPGPKGDSGPPGAAAPSKPVVKRTRSWTTTLKSNGSAVIAKVLCPEATCEVAKRSAKIKIHKHHHKLKVRGPRRVAQGEKAKVRVAVRRSVREELEEVKRARVTLKMVVRSTNGTEIHPTRTVLVRAK